MVWQRPRNAFTYKKKVLFKPTNVFGNVYFSNYVEWQGEARESLLLSYPGVSTLANELKQVQMITHSVYNRYIKSAYFGSSLDVIVQSSAIQPYSFILNFDVVDDATEDLIAQGWQKICFMSANGSKFICIPQFVVDLIKPIQKD